MNGSPLLPVYVIHYEAPEWCRETVRTLQASTTPVEVTVVNNGGELRNAGARVVDMPRNLGYTGAANWAIADSGDRPYLVITSHDLYVEPATLGRLLAAAHEHPDAGIIGANVGWRGDRLLGVDGEIEWRDWTSGSCLLLRRSCIDSIGGFDERLHSYGDDVDIAIRAVRGGWKVGRVLDARADHRGSAIGSSRRERLIMMNRLLVAFKHGGWPALGRGFAVDLPRHVGYQLKAGISSPRSLPTRIAAAFNEVIGAFTALRRLRTFRAAKQP